MLGLIRTSDQIFIDFVIGSDRYCKVTIGNSLFKCSWKLKRASKYLFHLQGTFYSQYFKFVCNLIYVQVNKRMILKRTFLNNIRKYISLR